MVLGRTVESSRCATPANPATRLVYISLVILFIINWLNFVDRVTLIGKYLVIMAELCINS